MTSTAMNPPRPEEVKARSCGMYTLNDITRSSNTHVENQVFFLIKSGKEASAAYAFSNLKMFTFIAMEND